MSPVVEYVCVIAASIPIGVTAVRGGHWPSFMWRGRPGTHLLRAASYGVLTGISGATFWPGCVAYGALGAHELWCWWHDDGPRKRRRRLAAAARVRLRKMTAWRPPALGPVAVPA